MKLSDNTFMVIIEVGRVFIHWKGLQSSFLE